MESRPERKRALSWFNDMNLEMQFYTTIKHNNLIKGDRTRHPNTLNCDEIELLYDAEHYCNSQNK